MTVEAEPGAGPRRRGIFYGWWIVAALAITQTVSWGTLYYGFPVFLTSMEADLVRSRAELTGAFSLALVFSALAAYPVGRWIDRHGARGLMTGGSIFAMLLLGAWSRVKTLEGLYLVMAGLGTTMAMVLYEPAFTVVAAWFSRYRRRALTAITLVAGLASTVFMPLETVLLERYGWRGALLVLAVFLGAVTIPLHALVLRRRPEDLGLVPDGVPLLKPEPARGAVEESIGLELAFKTISFWSLALTFILSGAAGVALSIHLVPYLLERGYSSHFAAAVAGSVGFMQLPGRLLFAPLGARLSRQALIFGVFATQALSVASLVCLPSLAGLFACVALFGMANGMATLLRAAVVAELFGPAHYGSIGGVLAFGSSLARAAGPFLAALLYTRAGSYSSAFFLLIGALLAAAISGYVAERAAFRLPNRSGAAGRQGRLASLTTRAP